MSEPEQKGHPFQRRWIIIAAVSLLALVFLIPFIQEGGARVDTSVIVETEKAFLGSIREEVSGTGEIEGPVTWPVTSPYGGLAAEVLAGEGEAVSQGDPILRLDEGELEKQISQLLDRLDELEEEIAQTDDGGSTYLLAGASGRVKRIQARRGDSAGAMTQAGTPLVEISTDGLLKITLPLAQRLEEGDSLTLRLGEQEAEGTLSALDPAAGTMTVTFPDGPDWPLGEEAAVLAEGEEVGRGPIALNGAWLLTASEGIVSELDVEEGDEVRAGEPLLRCILSQQDEGYLSLLREREELVDRLFALQEFTADPTVYAPQTGIVTGLTLLPGETVEGEVPLCQIASREECWGEVRLPAARAEQVAPGQSLQWKQGDVSCEGSVLSVEPAEGKDLVPVRLVIKGSLEAGATGEVTITTASAQEAVLVPKEAVRTLEDGSKGAEISYGDGLKRLIPVETGLEDGTYIQILSGIRAGEDVVISSRVVEKKVVEILGFEWVVEETGA